MTFNCVDFARSFRRWALIEPSFGCPLEELPHLGEAGGIWYDVIREMYTAVNLTRDECLRKSFYHLDNLQSFIISTELYFSEQCVLFFPLIAEIYFVSGFIGAMGKISRKLARCVFPKALVVDREKSLVVGSGKDPARRTHTVFNNRVVTSTYNKRIYFEVPGTTYRTSMHSCNVQ